MNQYKIEIYYYTPEGSVGGLSTTKYADTPEQAMNICAEYDSIMQTTTDEEGNEVATSMKKYQTRLYLLCYKLCQDKSAFFVQFKA